MPQLLTLHLLYLTQFSPRLDQLFGLLSDLLDFSHLLVSVTLVLFSLLFCFFSLLIPCCFSFLLIFLFTYLSDCFLYLNSFLADDEGGSVMFHFYYCLIFIFFSYSYHIFSHILLLPLISILSHHPKYGFIFLVVFKNLPDLEIQFPLGGVFHSVSLHQHSGLTGYEPALLPAGYILNLTLSLFVVRLISGSSTLHFTRGICITPFFFSPFVLYAKHSVNQT